MRHFITVSVATLALIGAVAQAIEDHQDAEWGRWM